MILYGDASNGKWELSRAPGSTNAAEATADSELAKGGNEYAKAHLRELIAGLDRGGSRLIDDPTRIFLRDLHDHTVQVIDTVETYRDMLSGMLDIYLSSVSNRMNEVMKVLTIIATIFIPLTFIVGVYGMNFKYMPELQWRWGYFATWLVMISITGFMLMLFRRRKWL